MPPYCPDLQSIELFWAAGKYNDDFMSRTRKVQRRFHVADTIEPRDGMGMSIASCLVRNNGFLVEIMKGRARRL